MTLESYSRLREIAERLTGNRWDMYLGSGDSRDLDTIADTILLDGRAIAEAYLAEHPADDDEPATDEWLCGALDGREYYNRVWTIGPFVLHLETRGDLRRLCKAMKIQLKEGY